MKPLIIAHRGASGSAPENTLAAFKLALERNADLVETDLHATADGELVLIHDSTLEHTTTGKGRVKDHTLEQVKALDAGVKFGEEFAGERVPTLREALDLLRDRALLLIELKAPDVQQTLADLLCNTDSLGHVVVFSFHADWMIRLREIEPRLPCGLLLDEVPPSSPSEAVAIVEAVRSCGANFAGLSGKILAGKPEIIEGMSKRGVPAWVWTLNEPPHIEMAKQYGVAGIITDYPERV